MKKYLFAAIILIFIGGSIGYGGRMWNFQLGNERYLVGGTLIAFGLYIIFLVATSKKHNSIG